MIGVLGGTFDPVHYGHLRPALEVGRGLGIDRLHVVPCGDPPHRPAPRACALHRLRMVEIAVSGEPRFLVDEREVRRAGPSYTVDTLRELRAEIGPSVPLCLVVGMDALRGLDGWSRWEEIPRLAHLVVMARPGSEAPREGPVGNLLAHAGTDDPAALRAAPAGRVHLFPVTRLDIAATRIRDEIARGLAPRYLLPDAVLDYIHNHGLYT